jgi:hypothetical protein
MDAKSGFETSSNAEPEESKDANATTHEKVYEYLPYYVKRLQQP